MTLKIILKRGGLTKEERRAVYADCDIEGINEDEPLSRAAFNQYARLLRKSSVFHQYIKKRSKMAYANTIGYLKAQGMMEQKVVAVVDSGWTGSMQRSLRQILESSGFTGKLVGFYFGMYAHPQFAADGEYHTWYFEAGGNMRRKIQFCNNLFECLLSAPHGMTVSYQKEGDRYEPVLRPAPTGKELQMIMEQSQEICRYAKKRLKRLSFEAFNVQFLQRETAQTIKRHMFLPTPAEAAFYGQFLFCDDVTEAYYLKLADGEQIAALKGYLLFPRICRTLLKKSYKTVRPELLWPYGIIAFLPKWKQMWYRWNILVWEMLRFRIKH